MAQMETLLKDTGLDLHLQVNETVMCACCAGGEAGNFHNHVFWRHQLILHFVALTGSGAVKTENGDMWPG